MYVVGGVEMFSSRFGSTETVRAPVILGEPANRPCWPSRRMRIAVGIALAGSALAASGAQAETCNVPVFPFGNVASVASVATSVSASIAADIAAANTAFLTQSSAFVSAPGNPQPDQQGGGVWTRGVVGQVNVTSASSNAIVFQVPPGTTPPGGTGSQPCTTTVRASFDGIQIGADIARLNVSGWNLHLGTTAGSLYLNNSIVGGAPDTVGFLSPFIQQVPFDSAAQVPFIGTYATVTNGGFYADFLIRADAYQMNINSPGFNFYNQNLNARGLSVSGSTGYNYQIPDSGGWFIEPSAGLIYSRVKVDPLNIAGTPSLFAGPISGTETFSDIVDTIGRLGLRVGTSLSYGALSLQPFVAASVWHDFAGNASAQFSTCTNCANFMGVPAALTDAFSGTNIGTYGQYSVGVSAAIADTGWRGFMRADYRNGPSLSGWDGTGGFRYQFTPGETTPTVMATKSPIFKAPAAQAVSWQGLYVGAFAGAEEGKARWGYGTGSVDPGVGGILGGFDLGYNWQSGPWVYGLEGDWTWTDAKGGIGCGPQSETLAFVYSPLFGMTCNAQHSWVASITPRLGYAWGRELFYVKGGVAVTREQFAATCNFGPENGITQICSSAVSVVPFAFSTGFNAGDVRAGWTIGYGVEFALTRNWSAKAETDYVDFGNHALVASDGTALNVGLHSWQTKIGVNYRFDGGPLVDSAAPALAAALPVKAPPRAVPSAAPTWAGCYVGASLGGAFADVKYAAADPGIAALSPVDAANLAAVSTGTLNAKSAIAGGEGGCNWQVRGFVFGMETDVSGFGNFQANRSAAILTPIFSQFTANSAASANWLFTLRPRLGVAYDHWLVYATGGLAFANFNFSQSIFYNDFLLHSFNPTITPLTQSGSFNAIVPGWVVGGGIEYALSNNWSVKSEFLHVSFAHRSMMETNVILVADPNVSTARLGLSIVRAGLDYKL
jgi:opacity protein-like surface antigen